MQRLRFAETPCLLGTASGKAKCKHGRVAARDLPEYDRAFAAECFAVSFCQDQAAAMVSDSTHSRFNAGRHSQFPSDPLARPVIAMFQPSALRTNHASLSSLWTLPIGISVASAISAAVAGWLPVR